MSKYYKYLNTFFVVAPMTFFMAMIAIFRGEGFIEGWHRIFITSWLTMLPIVGKITNRIINLKK